MASITITVPDQYVTRVVDALCVMGHWSEDLGVTKAAFAKAEVERLIKERVLAYERRVAQAAVPDPAPLDM